MVSFYLRVEKINEKNNKNYIYISKKENIPFLWNGWLLERKNLGTNNKKQIMLKFILNIKFRASFVAN